MTLVQRSDIVRFLTNYAHVTKYLPDTSIKQNSNSAVVNKLLRPKRTPYYSSDTCAKRLEFHNVAALDVFV